MKHLCNFPIFFYALAACLLVCAASPAIAVEPGQAAPTFQAKALDGKGTLSLASYQGQVVYLDFWASWCGPCAAALPAIDQLQKEFADQGFQVLAVNVDQDVKDARRFLSRRPVGYPSVADPTGSIPTSFDVETMPTSFLIDRNGVVQYVHKGFRSGDEKELRSHIQALVARQ
jgi:thiol-disulfide isomerase/thioredoxin